MAEPTVNQACPEVAEEGMTEATEQRSDSADSHGTQDCGVVAEGDTEKQGSDSLRRELICAQDELRQCIEEREKLRMENQCLKQALLEMRVQSAMGLYSGVLASIPRCPGCQERGAFDVASAAASTLSGESTDDVAN